MDTIWIVVAIVNLLDLVFGAILNYTSHRFAVKDDPVVERIDEILPQSQCGQCGYLGCHPYAEAISCNGEKINRCVLGGETAILKIAELLDVEPQPLDGGARELTPARMAAMINENNCIGCTKCIQTCLINAIVGATRATHTAMSDLCTGYNLYIDPCPTHYIPLQPVIETSDSWKWDLNITPVRIVPVEHHA